MPQPSEASFETLYEDLLKAGIAPRYARPYVRQLEDHLQDLIAEQTARGYEGEDALLRARALLGSDEELTAAMAACRRFHALTARAPWLVCGLVPPVAMVAGLVAFGLSLAVAASPLHAAPGAPFPAWCGPAAHILCLAANYGIGPLVALAVVVTAARQRLPRQWPGLGIAVAALFSAVTTLAIELPQAGHHGSVAVGLGTNLPLALAASRVALTVSAALAMYLMLKRAWRTA